MLWPVNPTDLALAAGAVLALLALSWWLRGRARGPRDSESDAAKRRFSGERFDTTLGELRDMREALRPVQRRSSKPPLRPRGEAPRSGRVPTADENPG